MVEVFDPNKAAAVETAQEAGQAAIQETFLPTVEPGVVFAANGRGPATGPVVKEGSVCVPTM